MTVYTTWYGYSQCDPLATIAGPTEAAVRDSLTAALTEEEERSKDQCATYDLAAHTEDDCPFCNPNLVWAGRIWAEDITAVEEYCGVQPGDMEALRAGEVIYLSP